MKAKVLALTLNLLLITLALHAPANAQVEKATFHLDAFFCGNECAWAVKRVMSAHDELIAHVDVDKNEKAAFVYPDARVSFDLYQLQKELRNAEQAPKRISVIVTGEVTDYAKVYSGAVLTPQKVLRIKETGQRFVLFGKHLSNLLDAVETGGSVTVSGTIVGFREKHLPVLVVEDFTPNERNLVKNEETGGTQTAAKSKV